MVTSKALRKEAPLAASLSSYMLFPALVTSTKAEARDDNRQSAISVDVDWCPSRTAWAEIAVHAWLDERPSMASSMARFDSR